MPSEIPHCVEFFKKILSIQPVSRISQVCVIKKKNISIVFNEIKVKSRQRTKENSLFLTNNNFRNMNQRFDMMDSIAVIISSLFDVIVLWNVCFLFCFKESLSCCSAGRPVWLRIHQDLETSLWHGRHQLMKKERATPSVSLSRQRWSEYLLVKYQLDFLKYTICINNTRNY